MLAIGMYEVTDKELRKGVRLFVHLKQVIKTQKIIGCVHTCVKELVGMTLTLKLFAINFLLVDSKSFDCSLDVFNF